ncbi:hypothetical protein CR513_50396, partial [Mucuna pruriens]
MIVQAGKVHAKDPVISFSKVDYHDIQPHQDDLMVISIVVAYYKVERVLVDQRSSTNIEEAERPQLVYNLKEIQIGSKSTKTTKIGGGLGSEEEKQMICFLKKNKDIFAWAPKDMSEIDLDFLCHQLSIAPRARPIA